MPIYKSVSNKPEIIYNNIILNPGVETIISRYINLNTYPFLIKISDTPYINELILLQDINSSCISTIQDFEKSVNVRMTDSGCNIGDTVKLGIILGNTDNIVDFILVKTLIFKLITVSPGINIWECNEPIIKFLEYTNYKFYCISVIDINISGAITVHVNHNINK